MTVPVTVSERDLVALLGIVTDAELRRRGIPALTTRQWGPAAPCRRGLYQLPERPAAGPVRSDRAQAPGEHLQPAPGVQPGGSGHPCLRHGTAAESRPDAELISLRVPVASSRWHKW